MPQHQSTTKAWRPTNTDNGPGRGWTMFASLMYCNSRSPTGLLAVSTLVVEVSLMWFTGQGGVLVLGTHVAGTPRVYEDNHIVDKECRVGSSWYWEASHTNMPVFSTYSSPPLHKCLISDFMGALNSPRALSTGWQSIAHITAVTDKTTISKLRLVYLKTAKKRKSRFSSSKSTILAASHESLQKLSPRRRN